MPIDLWIFHVIFIISKLIILEIILRIRDKGTKTAGCFDLERLSKWDLNT